MLYVEKGTPKSIIDRDLDTLAHRTYVMMKQRLMKFDPFQLSELVEVHGRRTLITFLMPLRLLKNVGSEYFYELVDRYQSDHACDFPWDILFKDPEVIEAY
jgi:hypothetical protein